MIVLAVFLPQVSAVIPTSIAVVVTAIALLGSGNKLLITNTLGARIIGEPLNSDKEKSYE